VPEGADGRRRVLLVLGESTGGIGRHVKSLAEGLPDHGVQVTVCAPGPTITSLGLDGLDARIVAAPVGRLGPGAVRTTRRILRREAAGTDVAHAHGLRAGADCAAFVPDVPLVVTWHNAPLGGPVWQRAHAALAHYVARSADLTLAASEDLAEDARAAGAERVITVFVAAPPLRPASRSAAAVRADLDVGGRPLVLALGRLHHQKRFDVLIDAAAHWADDNDLPIVVIAGDGPERAALAAQISRTNAPVVLLGARDDIADLLTAADVVALPSEWEARALVAQEALRAGVPLVTTPVGGLPSLVGDAAMIVPVGDAGALRTAIERVLTDPHERRRMVAAGFAQASSWPDEGASLDQLVEWYAALSPR
jgi:glycosyltransferase involved in cell wall biosynthesis